MVRDLSWWFTWHVSFINGRTLLDTSLHQILLFAIVLYGVPVLWNRYLLCSISLFAVGLQGQKRANGALCSRIFAPLNAEFEPRFRSRVQKHQLRASNGERSKNRVTFDPFFSVRRSPFAVQFTKSQPKADPCGDELRVTNCNFFGNLLPVVRFVTHFRQHAPYGSTNEPHFCSRINIRM